MRYTRRGLAVALLVAVGLAVGCQRQDSGSAPPVKPSVKVENKKITICQFAQVFVYLPLYVAQEKGFFADEGLDVSLIAGGGDDKTFAAVASGQAQFGVADPTFAAIARERGQPGVVLASVVNGATFWGVTFREDIGKLDSPAKFKGLKLATYQGPSTNYTLMAKTLKDNGDAVGDAKIVQGAFGTLLAMLEAKTADVAMELEPTVSIAVEKGANVVCSYPEMYGPFLLTGLYTTEEYRDANPEICQKAVNALERAVRYAHSDPAGTVAIARKVFPELSPEVAKNAVERLLQEKTIPEHVTIDSAAWENAVQVRLEVGDLKSSDAAQKTIDGSFAKKAVDAINTEPKP